MWTQFNWAEVGRFITLNGHLCVCSKMLGRSHVARVRLHSYRHTRLVNVSIKPRSIEHYWAKSTAERDRTFGSSVLCMYNLAIK